MNRFLTYLIVLCVAVASVSYAQKPLNPHIDSLFPSEPTSYLMDVAGAVNNPADVNVRLKAIQDSQHIGMVAVTLPTIKDYEPYEVAMEIGRKWKVATKNDTLSAVTHNAGAVILLVMDKHNCFIATATGTEGYITDATAGRLCADQRDNFRAGEFGAGIINIANGIAERGREEAATAATVRRPQPETPTDWSFLWWVAGAIAAVGGLVWWAAIKAEAERVEREKRWAEQNARMQAELAKRRAEELRLERERAAREKARWDALTPAQQQEELRIKEEQRIERERLAAIAAAEATERRKKRQQEEEEERRRHPYSSGYGSTDYGSSSSSDSGGGFSIGGSDSFSGGGGGSSW